MSHISSLKINYHPLQWVVVDTLIIQFGGKVFSTVPMDLKHYGLALAIAALIIPIDMIRKAITNK